MIWLNIFNSVVDFLVFGFLLLFDYFCYETDCGLGCLDIDLLVAFMLVWLVVFGLLVCFGWFSLWVWVRLWLFVLVVSGL